jgi:hypothetical protein
LTDGRADDALRVDREHVREQLAHGSPSVANSGAVVSVRRARSGFPFWLTTVSVSVAEHRCLIPSCTLDSTDASMRVPICTLGAERAPPSRRRRHLPPAIIGTSSLWARSGSSTDDATSVWP